jgi:hypothetical protein
MALERSLAPDVARSLLVSVGDALREELVASEPAPQSLMKLLTQLDDRIQADIERERWYAAVDHAVAELVRAGASTVGLTQEP